MIKNYNNFILEFKSEDIKLIMNSLQNYFTIGFEIEIEMDKETFIGLKYAPRYESILMYPSIRNRKVMEDFKRCFHIFYNKYEHMIDFHEDFTLTYGVEITNKKQFNNINESIDYINDFFNDFKDQNHWKFNHRTSIHVNIGTIDNLPINVVKGVIMISDQPKSGFVFKGIEDRLETYCSSLKQKLLKRYKKHKNNKLLTSNNIEEIESILNKEILDLYDFHGGVKAEMAGSKLYGLIFKKNYIEFRYVGGEKVTDNIMKDKIIYFCYLVYLMTSDYRKKEYIRKLFSFTNKLSEQIKEYVKYDRKAVIRPTYEKIINANIGDIFTESEVYVYVEYLHDNEDFFDGDIGERIEEYQEYILKEVNIDDIELNEWQLDEGIVEEFREMYEKTGTYPPIVISDYYSIIDGTHRANALKDLIKIKALVGKN